MTVALLMGSDSDFGRLELCVNTLKKLRIPVEVRVLSAHRTPKQLVEFVEGAKERGIRVFLCAAGGAAHLAGVVAAHTHLPVIGIPMDNPPVGGLDALFSTVQMPPGIPVACMGIGSSGGTNAALFAARILALGDDALAGRYAKFCADQAARVLKKDEKIRAKVGG